MKGHCECGCGEKTPLAKSKAMYYLAIQEPLLEEKFMGVK